MLSVVMPVFNDDQYVAIAVSALLNQTHADFELIIVNDNSTDKTLEKIGQFEDKRIVVVNNATNLGIAASRNVGVRISKGDFIFCSDSDCMAEPTWLENGLKELNRKGVIGVEGKTVYYKENYQPTFSDKLPGDISARDQYMCCNIAYRKEVFTKLEGFDTRFGYHEDREFALRALNLGGITYCDTMLVTHQKKVWTISEYIKSAKRPAYRVLLYKYNGDLSLMTGRIMFARDLLKVIFPPLILYSMLNNKFRSWDDIRLIPFIYIRSVCLRYFIWKAAIKERVFVI